MSFNDSNRHILCFSQRNMFQLLHKEIYSKKKEKSCLKRNNVSKEIILFSKENQPGNHHAISKGYKQRLSIMETFNDISILY